MAGPLIDTSVVIDHLRGREPATSFLVGLVPPPSLSVVSVTELYAGVHDGVERRELEGFLSCCRLIEVDTRIAQEAGLILRTYRRSHSVGVADALIAATALHHGLDLATLNREHFLMIPGLVVPY